MWRHLWPVCDSTYHLNPTLATQLTLHVRQAIDGWRESVNFTSVCFRIAAQCHHTIWINDPKQQVVRMNECSRNKHEQSAFSTSVKVLVRSCSRILLANLSRQPPCKLPARTREWLIARLNWRKLKRNYFRFALFVVEVRLLTALSNQKTNSFSRHGQTRLDIFPSPNWPFWGTSCGGIMTKSVRHKPRLGLATEARCSHTDVL